MIRCSNCPTGTLRRGKTKDHNIGPLFGLDVVLLDRAVARTCSDCGHVVLEGDVIEAARRDLALFIVKNRTCLAPREARFLRETIGMTQAQLAERLDIIRGTVTRWESGEGDLGPIQSFALRTLAAWSLDGTKLAEVVSAPDAKKPSIVATQPYRIAASALPGAA
ncbi:MAG: helix-turn-helix domain-containing protein [Polyangiaceae bacterium]|nr:helix-turn-helix domain-containing protein [Polyangiaceae bacterium]MBK8943577.1 helix-turn-helix domain-containing protein [Polyangiaceae bacterium]